MEKQICGIANQVTDVFGYGYMQPFMNDAAFNNMFTEDFKTGQDTKTQPQLHKNHFQLNKTEFI